MNIIDGQENVYIGFQNENMHTNGETEVIRHYVKKNDVVFDVGCNVGSYAQYIQECVDVELHIFEPIREFFDISSLRLKNAKLNNIALGLGSDSNIHINKIITDDEDKKGMSSICEREVYDDMGLEYSKEIIEMMSLDDYCNSVGVDHIDFLKIDTEGYELNVLKGAPRMLNNIDKIQIEFGMCWKDNDCDVSEFVNIIEWNGFKCYRISKNGLIRVNDPRNYFLNFNSDFKFQNVLLMR
jgi:FkbM family methyltransferase